MPKRKRYRARVDLWYPTDPKVVAKLAAGERVPEYDQKHLRAGEVADDIPPVSVPWLLADGLIEDAGGDAT